MSNASCCKLTQGENSFKKQHKTTDFSVTKNKNFTDYGA